MSGKRNKKKDHKLPILAESDPLLQTLMAGINWELATFRTEIWAAHRSLPLKFSKSKRST